jgi:hypothetical protein
MFVLTYRKPLVIFLTGVGLISFLSSASYFAGLKVPIDGSPYFPLFFGFFVVVVLPFSIYRSAKKSFSSNERINEKIIYEFTEDKIKITGETFNSELSWEKTYKILELKNWFLIYQSSLIANVIPKNAFGDDLKEFKELIGRKPFIKK